MKKVLAVVSVIAISLAVVAMIAWNVSSDVAPLGASGAGGQTRQVQEDDATADTIGPDGQARISAQVQRLDTVSQADAAILAKRSTELLNLYHHGDPQAFKDWLHAMGQEYVPPSRGTAYATDDEQWKARAEMVGKATFDLNASHGVVVSHRGELQPPPNLTGRSKIGNARKINANGTPDPNETTVIEVIVPARQMQSLEGVKFDGSVGIVFGKRPSDGEWVLQAVNLYDFPAGTTVAPLPA